MFWSKNLKLQTTLIADIHKVAVFTVLVIMALDCNVLK